MTSYKKLANLDEIKLMAGGNPQKMAKYSMLRREYEAIKSEHFNEEFPFVQGFDESHLIELKEYAEANPDDESAQVRYNLQKERFAVQEAKKMEHIDLRVAKQDLMRKLRQGKVDKTDLQNAESLARKITSIENRTLYSQIKSLVEKGANK